ncbi:MAG: DEAD/DEAH box helicase [Victivallaceae bacterium]|nr:DEAD/DEAH box helicase [Victivallaceae bacterium]
MKKSNKKPHSKYPSWNTTDEHEIKLRKSRALTESMIVKRISEGSNVFADYMISKKDNDNPVQYKVEIRSLQKCFNHCSCPDFKKNSLGTCKHIEKVLSKIKAKKKDSPFIEIFVDFGSDAQLTIEFPPKPATVAMTFLKKYLDISNNFKKPIENTLQVFLRDYEQASSKVRNEIRVSGAVLELAGKLSSQRHNQEIQKKYAVELRKVAGEAEFLRFPLYDYQIDGMLHLAFTERAMLADEMGLGKTVQAIAAANVLRNIHNIKRVLIICPASLKAEWEEQINKFTSLSSTVLFGDRKFRLDAYKNCANFFLITNYEQIVRDYNEVNQDFTPDLVILDEAQRIKNWKTKTAQSIKKLQSRFAFVLTGTPLENRIEELYSLVDYIDNTVFGSLFRFNRQYYDFDIEGKTDGFKNLRQLHEKIQPIMMRRRKDEIAEQLPERIDNNYFVKLTPEQSKRYSEYDYRVLILMRIAEQRPLRPEEHERLQRWLACMRMLCDSCYIMDQEITDSPKVDELLKILTDLWDNDPGRKVIIFSEWVRMLDLVQVQLKENKIDFAWHVGSVPQNKRRDEIKKFKNDLDCRVFLSSDSGGLGLNLQAASVVINMDLPWNPARLEQRIARAWRKHQKNVVNVINLVAEGTIEHKMIATLKFKQGLADGVLDGRGDIDLIESPNARNTFIERLAEIMNTTVAAPPKDVSAVEQFEQEIRLDAGENTKLCASIIDEATNEIKSVFAVSNKVKDTASHLAQVIAKTNNRVHHQDITVVDEATYQLLQNLAEKGLITINEKVSAALYKTESMSKPKPDITAQKVKMAQNILKRAERQLKMASVLFAGGFEEEATSPAKESIDISVNALSVLGMNELPETEPSKFDVKLIDQLKIKLDMRDELVALIKLCCGNVDLDAVNLSQNATALIDETNKIIAKISL